MLAKEKEIKEQLRRERDKVNTSLSLTRIAILIIIGYNIMVSVHFRTK